MAAALLLSTSAATYFGDGSADPRQTRRVAQESPRARTESPKLPEVPARMPAVAIELADDQELLAVRMPTDNENVTVVWMYPTVQ